MDSTVGYPGHEEEAREPRPGITESWVSTQSLAGGATLPQLQETAATIGSPALRVPLSLASLFVMMIYLHGGLGLGPA